MPAVKKKGSEYSSQLRMPKQVDKIRLIENMLVDRNV